MMVSFDTNILVYATVSGPLRENRQRARSPLTWNADGVVHLQRGNSQIDTWRAVLPVQGTQDDDLSAALDAVKNRPLAFWDATFAAQRAGAL